MVTSWLPQFLLPATPGKPQPRMPVLFNSSSLQSVWKTSHSNFPCHSTSNETIHSEWPNRSLRQRTCCFRSHGYTAPHLPREAHGLMAEEHAAPSASEKRSWMAKKMPLKSYYMHQNFQNKSNYMHLRLVGHFWCVLSLLPVPPFCAAA